MKNIAKYILAASLFIFPLLAISDTYPINKNIDIKHYSFEISVSDASDKIIGNTQITIFLKKDGVRNIRLDLINKSIE